MALKKTSSFYKFLDCEEEIEKLYHTTNKPKRLRLKLSDIQITVLEKIYFRNSYPNKDEHEAISKKLRIPLKNVKIWFQNRRAKQKSEFEELEIERRRISCSKKESLRKFEGFSESSCSKKESPQKNAINIPEYCLPIDSFEIDENRNPNCHSSQFYCKDNLKVGNLIEDLEHHYSNKKHSDNKRF